MARQRTLGAPVPLPTRHRRRQVEASDQRDGRCKRRRQVPYVGVADDRVYSDRDRQRHSSGGEDCLPQAPRGSGAPQATERRYAHRQDRSAEPRPIVRHQGDQSGAEVPQFRCGDAHEFEVLGHEDVCYSHPADAQPSGDRSHRSGERGRPARRPISRRGKKPRPVAAGVPARAVHGECSGSERVPRRRWVGGGACRFRAGCPSSRSPDKRESWRTRRCRLSQASTMPTLRRRAGERASARGRARRFPSPPLRTQLCRES